MSPAWQLGQGGDHADRARQRQHRHEHDPHPGAAIHPPRAATLDGTGRPSRGAEVFADRTGALFPAPASRVGPPRIVIYATSDTWIRVRDVDQSILFDDVLHPGGGYAVPNAPGLTLRTGKAEALEIAVDGKTAPSIGSFMTRRDVLLDPDALLAGTTVEQ
jgi:cytoskeleton protein RodZ